MPGRPWFAAVRNADLVTQLNHTNPCDHTAATSHTSSASHARAVGCEFGVVRKDNGKVVLVQSQLKKHVVSAALVNSRRALARPYPIGEADAVGLRRADDVEQDIQSIPANGIGPIPVGRPAGLPTQESVLAK